MPAKLDIPLSYTAEAILKRELERLATGIYKYTQDAAAQFEPRPTILPITDASICAATFDAVLRVAPRDGQVIVVQLPRPDPKNGGRRLLVQRMNVLGAIVLQPIGGSVNTFARLQMSTMPGIITARFDGENYFTDQPGVADWGEGL